MRLRTRLREVIPMKKSKPYAAVPVNRVALEPLTRGRAGCEVVVGFDVGKFEVLAVARWGDKDFGRPWRIQNPEQIRDLVPLLVQLGQGRAYALTSRSEQNGAGGRRIEYGAVLHGE